MLKPPIKYNRKLSYVLTPFFLMFFLLILYTKGNCFVVLSGSMEPAIPTGSLIFTFQDEQILTGDIITFQKKDAIITHRVIGQTQDRYMTKGDANSLVDAGTVSMTQIIGKVFFHIPYLGYLITFLQSFPLLLIPICLLSASVSKIVKKGKHAGERE